MHFVIQHMNDRNLCITVGFLSVDNWKPFTTSAVACPTGGDVIFLHTVVNRLRSFQTFPSWRLIYIIQFIRPADNSAADERNFTYLCCFSTHLDHMDVHQFVKNSISLSQYSQDASKYCGPSFFCCLRDSSGYKLLLQDKRRPVNEK